MLALPLAYRGEPVGQLLLAPRAPGEGLTPADRRLLDELARQAGVAAHGVRLTADLQRANANLHAARERLVTAREDERRRLRRDLHDGLGPALGAASLKVGAIRKLLRRDPAAADALLAEIGRDIEATVGDVRRLVYDLRPPALDDLGLVGALREVAARRDRAGLRVAVEAPDRLPPLPAAVEVAAYRLAGEALTNVVKHARARRCAIRLAAAEHALLLEIADDGVGLPPERKAGVGLLSMRERAAEVGGAFAVEAPPGGGTRVLARLPLGESSVVGRHSPAGLPGAPEPPLEPTVTSGHLPPATDD